MDVTVDGKLPEDKRPNSADLPVLQSPTSNKVSPFFLRRNNFLEIKKTTTSRVTVNNG